MQAFSLGAQFAHESAMLKLPEQRGKWGELKGTGRGRGERRENENLVRVRNIVVAAIFDFMTVEDWGE